MLALQNPSKIEMFLARVRGLNFALLKRKFTDLFLEPSNQLYYKIDVFNKDGSFKSTTGEKQCHSFVLQMVRTLEFMSGHTYNGFLSGSHAVSIRNTGNTESSVQVGGMYEAVGYVAYWLNTDAGAGTLTAGIIAGTGTTAPTVTDYKIETVIAHGTGSGQLSYGVSTGLSPSTFGSDTTFTFVRVLSNGSAGTITIREIALYWYSSYNGLSWMIVRDACNQAVASGEYVVISFTWRTTI